MTLREQAEAHRERLLAALDDDAAVVRLPAALARLSRDLSIDASAALLFLLTGLAFEEHRAQRHWDAIVDDLQELRGVLKRPVGVRTAVLDYFVNIHPQLEMPALVGEHAEPHTTESLDGAGCFREWVDREVRRARRYGHTVGVVLADLDDFTAFNAEHGADAGDRVLAEVARRLGALVREHDRVARPGEDEFGLLLPGADRAETATAAERLCRAVADPIDVGAGPSAAVRVSAGYALFPADAPAADSLLERAAQALYEAQAQGGGRAVAWRPERRRHLRRENDAHWVAHVRCPAGAVADRVHLHDVSREGLAFFSETPLDVGAAVEVRFGSSADGEIARRGTVVHLDRRLPAGDDRAGAGYRVGVAFEPPTGPDHGHEA